MKEGLILGMAIGIIAGAVIVGSSKKAQDIVEKGKKAVKKKIEKMQ